MKNGKIEVYGAREHNLKNIDADIPHGSLTVITGLMLAFGNGLDILLVIAGIMLAADGVIGLLNALKK